MWFSACFLRWGVLQPQLWLLRSVLLLCSSSNQQQERQVLYCNGILHTMIWLGYAFGNIQYQSDAACHATPTCCIDLRLADHPPSTSGVICGSVRHVLPRTILTNTACGMQLPQASNVAENTVHGWMVATSKQKQGGRKPGYACKRQKCCSSSGDKLYWGGWIGQRVWLCESRAHAHAALMCTCG